MNNEYNDYNKDDEYTPRHANDFYQNSSNDLIIDNNLNYINTNDDNILDTINKEYKKCFFPTDQRQKEATRKMH